MQQLNRVNFNKSRYTTKIMQFGEGNFLRAFVDWQIDILNETTDLNAGIAIIRPIDYDALPLLNVQDGLYTTIIRGLNEQGEAVADTRIISSVNEEIPIYKDFAKYMALAESADLKIIFSNTTEAGIEYIELDKLTDTPAKAFPAKLTQWLHHRFEFFNGSTESGVVIIPCELIDYNGEKLKEIVLQYCALWQLSDNFVSWLTNANYFCSTLVDRIVTGFPRDEHQQLQEEFNYLDNFMVTAEHFHLFVIQGPKHLAKLLHLDESALNIVIVDDISPYKQRKVAILNGAHTALVPLAYMSNIDAVGEALTTPLFEQYLESLIFNEIIPTLDLPKNELQAFANDVLNRFRNPYIHHLLMAISLNSMAKFKTRLLPQLLKFVDSQNTVPTMMALAIAGQILFFKGERNAEKIDLSDSDQWLALFDELWTGYNNKVIGVNELVEGVLGASWHWEQNLNEISGLTEQVSIHLKAMLKQGVSNVLTQALKGK
ncbi:tagaturonate reductase [Colwellia sp. MB02u-18]|uniref:tagaturonate reductase n=1 Tax=unclassified Colwellia TaxID=196834 RepID=UPI0015F53A13|nr:MULTISPECIES: tagaturonate reductase [unclassified Colwellia]MBA6222639.1 tagaturonate reductase [Colwellia sp. MB3u-45]MBA6269173.1 tagaturonate reductase [Colwellia sp. MB3u-43]MBA6322772.1 tagaturonate reductase [Colwellia sp. MB02u-19]MBA6323455.1 tagaturonate reductase [Colwellia sp. MB02u-18]MBA6332915.1 tagaturonate reductase [Colwellia sp. MB02u-12]